MISSGLLSVTFRQLDFERVIELAVVAGLKSSADATLDVRTSIVEDLARCCDLANQRQVTIATEFHAGTLTDDTGSCLALIREVDRPNMRTFWQPPNGMTTADALAGLQVLLLYVSNLHVFHWWPEHRHRLPLVEGSERWAAYLQQAASDGKRRFASLEFVRDDDVEQFRQDAATLRSWLGEHS
jgi:sugar phosphate isomerase/epimerase